jgi:hypothetical protein
MGLDITAYRRITKLDVALDSDDEPVDPITREPVGYDFRAYLNADFPGRADEIEDRAIYSAEDSMCLHAGGYGGYNHWREQLAELAGYIPEDYEQYGRVRKSHCMPCWNGAEGPFAELINFSDCEGVIGCSVSAKLAKDFAEFQSKADSHKDEYFRAKYTEWRKAFEMAADQGAVEFH